MLTRSAATSTDSMSPSAACRAVPLRSSNLVPGWELDVHTQRVGQHLTPERAAGEAASGPDLANLVAGGAH